MREGWRRQGCWEKRACFPLALSDFLVTRSPRQADWKVDGMLQAAELAPSAEPWSPHSITGLCIGQRVGAGCQVP